MSCSVTGGYTTTSHYHIEETPSCRCILFATQLTPPKRLPLTCQWQFERSAVFWTSERETYTAHHKRSYDLRLKKTKHSKVCILVFVKDTCGIIEESSPLESTYWKTLTQRERRKGDSLWVFTHVVVQPKDLVFTTDSSPTSENQVVILFVREDTIIQKQVILNAASDCDTFVWG